MKKDKTETKALTETQDEQVGSKGSRIAKAIVNTLINILIVLILVVSIVVAAMALTSRADPNGLPNIFGYTVQYVQTNSMDVPSPDGYEGGCFTDKDVIIGRSYNDKEFPEFNVGDIVTYNSHEKDESGSDRLITHRIVDKKKADNGFYVYQTWGDNREVATVPDQQEVEKYLQTVDIVAVNYTEKYQGKTLTGFADFFRFLRSQLGFFVVILIPMILFFIYAIIRVVISATNYKKEKAAEEKQEAVDAAVAEALAQQEKQNAGVRPEDMTPEQLEQFKKFLEQQKAEENSTTDAE